MIQINYLGQNFQTHEFRQRDIAQIPFFYLSKNRGDFVGWVYGFGRSGSETVGRQR